MKNRSKFNLRLSAITVGVLGLFAVSSAMADDEEIKALTQPKSSVQVEMIGVDQNSAKFGEYNGLAGHPSGAYPNGGFSVKGGNGYTNNEQGDTTRYSVTGENLGLTSRSANASIAEQGSWNFGVNFDQLQHNITNTYQTPYNGSMGGNTFTLPSNLSSPNGLDKTQPGSQPFSPAGVGTNKSVVSSDLQGMGISTTRYNTTLNGTAIVDKSLNFTFEYNNLVQTGAKLMAFGGSTYGNGTGSNSGNAQVVSILPNPTNYQTDTLNLAVNWKGENSFVTASYFGSFFKDNYNSVNWQAFSTNASGSTALTPMQTMSTAPSNAFNQLNLNGGYDFSSKTKLTSNISIGQNTQNQGFGGTYDAAMVTPSQNSTLKSAYALPTSSMNGLVNTTHADIKLTDQSVKDLNLSASAKYDERNNLTQSNIYNFSSLSGTAGLYPNTPLSNKQLQLALGGDYRLTKDQKLNLTLANNNIERWCNQYGAANSLGGNAANYPGGTNCVNATSSNENVANLAYKLKANEDLNFKATAGYSNRKTQWNQQALAAFVDNNINGSSSYAPGYNGANAIGFQPYFEASRKQFLGKANANWQATENLAFTLGGKYTNDLYPDSKYGVQNGNSWSLNLDGTYAYAEQGTVSAYATQQNQFRTMTMLQSASTGNAWNNSLTNKATTLGLAFKQAELVDGKLTLMGDATMSFAASQYNTGIPYAVAGSGSGITTVAAGCSAPNSVYNCGMLPAIQNNLGVLKLSGIYQLDKNSKVGLMYWYQHLYSNDYYYNAYQYGSAPTNVMPTNQTSPSYNVNVFAVNYTYSFD